MELRLVYFTNRLDTYTLPALQAGVLEKSMQTAEKAGKSFVNTEKAIDSISKESEATFMEAMEKQVLPDDSEMKLVDVTHQLFAKQPEQKFVPSSICIYKGIIANLISWGRNDHGGKLCGIMAGDGKSVLDVVVCTDFDSCILSDSLKQRWANFDIQPMGLVVWVTDYDSPIDQFGKRMQALKSPFKTLVLVTMCGGLDPMVWDVSISEEDEIEYTRRSGPKEQSGRNKDEKYRVVDFQALSKTIACTMDETVSAYLESSVKEKLGHKMKKMKCSEKTSLEQQCAPADGYCLWHSVLGSLDFEAWSTVPRKESGYAANARIVKNEEDKARALMKMTMEKACEQGVDIDKVEEIRKHGSVDIADLDWVANALMMNIRCTISDEAHLCGSGGWAAAFPLNKYIYIYYKNCVYRSPKFNR